MSILIDIILFLLTGDTSRRSDYVYTGKPPSPLWVVITVAVITLILLGVAVSLAWPPA
jgi:hypothetical protein